MNISSAGSLVKLPSFSIILETENLANADVKGLFKSLVSLAYQDLPPTQANEVLLIDTGYTPQQLIEQIHEVYPWIKVITAPADINYYETKMLGAKMSTGEVVVYTDSNCLYEPTWLPRILAGFIQGDNIQIVTGETGAKAKGIYTTAMSITGIFPPFSEQENLMPTSQYCLSNVAFRREFLLTHPIPIDLPLYRGNCLIHAHKLSETGYTIWQQPQARATHALPNGISELTWQFLLIGYDLYWFHHLTSKNTVKNQLIHHVQDQLEQFSDRFTKIFFRHPRRLLHLPLAIPIVLFSLIFIIIAYTITIMKPDFLLKKYQMIFRKV